MGVESLFHSTIHLDRRCHRSLLEIEADRHAMRKRAYLHSRRRFGRIRRGLHGQLSTRACRTNVPAPRYPRRHVRTQTMDSLPTLNTYHLVSMTDDTGILQHAIFSLPNCLEGYTTDDNARALIVAILLNGSPQSYVHPHAALSRRYIAFLWFAFQDKTGRFRNFLSYDRTWQEEVGTEDSHGRALWAVGTIFSHSEDAGLRGATGRLFETAFPAVFTFTSPRAWAFSILGMQAIWTGFRETESSKVLAIRWPMGSWTSMSALIPRHGAGLKAVFHIRMPGFHRRC